MSDYDPLPYCALLSRATSPSSSSQSTAIALSFLPASNHFLANVPIQGLRRRESVLMSAEEDFTQSKPVEMLTRVGLRTPTGCSSGCFQRTQSTHALEKTRISNVGCDWKAACLLFQQQEGSRDARGRGICRT